jgi:hypothetical protein
MKKTFILFAFMLAMISCFCQTTKVEYIYDTSGNRISRQIVTIPAKSSTIENQEVTETVIGEKKVMLYPNPTNGILNIDFSNWGEKIDIKLFVVDLNGKMIIRKTFKSLKNIVDITSLPNGVYILKIIADGENLEYKIIKQ